MYLDTIVVVFSHLLGGGKISKRVQQKMLDDPIVREAVGLAHIYVDDCSAPYTEVYILASLIKLN